MLARYARPPGAGGVRWRSPRPMSAAGLVSGGGGSVFVKRHHVRVRTAAPTRRRARVRRPPARPRGAVPAVLRLAGGATAVRRGDFLYEVHAAGRRASICTGTCCRGHRSPAAVTPGRRAPRWPGFTGPRGFGLPAGRPAVLTSSCAVISRRPARGGGPPGRPAPGLARYLDGSPGGTTSPGTTCLRSAGPPLLPQPGAAVGTRRLASLQPHLDLAGPGRRRCRA